MLYKSFWSVPAYKSAVFYWRWKAAVYFALITAISAAAAVLILQKPADEFYTGFISPAVEAFKGVKIVGGKISTPEGKDIVVKNSSGAAYAMASQNYIDAFKTKDLLFAFENDRLSFYAPDSPEIFYPLAVFEAELEGRDITVLAPPKEFFKGVLLPVMASAITVLMNATYLAVLTMAAFIMSRTIYPKLGFLRCAKLAMIALTPSLFADIAAMSFMSQPVAGFFYAAISCGFVFFALKGFAKADAPAKN